MKNLISKVTENKVGRFFIIEKQDGTQYRADACNEAEFNEMSNMTINDWTYFLRTDMSYTKL